MQSIKLPPNLFQRSLTDLSNRIGGTQNVDRAPVLALVASGWRYTYAELFGQSFVDALDSAETDDKHHSEALAWHWRARLALINYELELDNFKKQLAAGVISRVDFDQVRERLQAKWYPDFWAYLAIWARGNMKTTLARYMMIVDAVLSVAHGVAGYALVVGGTKDKSRGTAKSIQTLLQSEKVKLYAPQLSVVKKNDSGTAQGWTADFINTAANYVFHFIGLDQGVAGANVDNIRPTFIIPDDVDDREDSPVIAEGRFKTLTGAVIGTRQWNTLFFFAQNLISRFAVLYRIYKQQVRIFANRLVTKPIPAVRDLKTEQQTVNGLTKDVVVGGKCTWKNWNLREVQNQIDAMTLPVFLVECQHEVEQARTGLMHKNYNDDVHPISYSQFAARYGSPDAWKAWSKVPFSDWARTKTKYHANVAGYLAVSSQNTALPGMTFCVPMSFEPDASPADVARRLLETLTPYAYGNKTWRDLVDDVWKRVNAVQHFESVTARLDFAKGLYANVIPKYSIPLLEKFRVNAGVNSHSEDTVRAMFNNGFGFRFVPSNPGEKDALDEINEAMRVDLTLPHLFKPGERGYTRWYVLCPDDRTATPVFIKGIAVYPPAPFPDVIAPDALHDSELFRYQMMNRFYAAPKLSEMGERIDTPQKLNDDFGQALQMVYYKKLLSNLALTEPEVVEEAIFESNPKLTFAAMRERSPDAKTFTAGQQMARLEAETEVRRKLGIPEDSFDWLDETDSFDGGW